MSKPKILITGASGFVGGFLVEEAINQDCEVVAAVRPSSNLKYIDNFNIRFVNIDLANPNQIEEIIKRENFTHIIHNAGLTRSKTPKKLFEVNSDSVANFVRAINRSKLEIQRFTLISSLAAYGPADQVENKLVSNKTIPNPLTNYGRSKLVGEKNISKSKVPYTILRPTAVYGPRERDLLAIYQTINRGLEIKIGFNDQYLTFIYVKDLVKVILDCTFNEKTLNKAYFVTDDQIYTSSQLNRTIKNILQKKTIKLRIPIFVLYAISVIIEVISGINGNFPPLNREKVKELSAKNWSCDISELKKDISFVPNYNLKSGLIETLNWYKNNNCL